MAKRQIFYSSFGFLVITLVLQPWRNSISQDDAAYAWSAISFASGHFQFHPSQLALALPQILLGALAIHLWPNGNFLSALNLVTWFVFFILFILTLRKSEHSPRTIASFFFFPIWIQYGASFLSDIYTGLFLVGILVLIVRPKVSIVNQLLLVALSSFLILQRQTMLAFPVFWATALGLDWVRHPSTRQIRRTLLCLALGILVGLFCYASLHHTLAQQGLVFWKVWSWKAYGFSAFFVFGQRLVQIWLAVGLFLLPFVNFRNLSKTRVFAIALGQAVFVLVLWVTQTPPLSAGILFTDYLPPAIGIGLVSMGIWGLQCLTALRSFHKLSAWSTLLAALVVSVFYVFQETNDIRYAMLLALPLLFHLPVSSKVPPIGHFYGYLVPLAVISIFTNQYNLNTTDARWEVGRALAERGVPLQEISSGYGHDLFYLGSDCVKKAILKIMKAHPDDPVKSQDFYEHFFAVARVYEDGWKSRFVVKPNQIFGRDLGLSSVRGLEKTAVSKDYYSYTLFGIRNQLIVIENRDFQPAWCFR